MGQPTPPGDIPLIEGLGSEWNEFVSAIPEDRRNELAPKLKERIEQYEPLKQYEDFARSGITSDDLTTALDVYKVIETDPRTAYEAIGRHLGISPQAAKEVVKEAQQTIDEGDDEDPRIRALQDQVNTLAEIALAQRQQTEEETLAQQQEEAIEKELSAIKKKYGEADFDEEEILMRMIHKGLSAEQAYQEYSGKVSSIRERRPAPSIMGTGGAIPRNAIDPTKTTSAETKNIVAQMMQAAAAQKRS